ncbi:MAG TPA: c-type cytochrome, partial [Ramlibacter sp.]|nr:c-type cytochrome [Ramlibacter sp.]
MFTSSRSSHAARFWMASLIFLAAAWLAAPAFAGNRSNEASQQTPAALYHNYCSVCHGDQGDGNSRAKGSMKPPPRDFTTAQSAQEMTRERMIAAVRTGVPGTAMVGWQSQMTEEQIAKVVDYVRNTFMSASIATDGSRGRQIYARVCSVCHGDRGTGSMWASANLRPAPRDFSSPAAKAELTRDRMIAAVAVGRPNTAMNGYGSRMSKEDMEAVVDYIRTAFMRLEGPSGISGTHARGIPAAEAKAAEKKEKQEKEKQDKLAAAAPSAPSAAKPAPVRADMSLPLPNGLKGDAVAGKKFYDANCATCHGTKGDGQGPRAYFINPKPRIFTNAEARAMFNRPVIFAATAAGRRGSEMPAWDKVLNQQEIADVSEYVFRAFIQPEKGNVAKKK